jgi:hypothetical protein
MKQRTNKELWILNLSKKIVAVEDLNFKVQIGAVINVYHHNPDLTEDQVERSMKSGSLFENLDNAKLKIVKKKVSDGKAKVRQIAQSNEPIKAVKTRTAIVIEQKTDEVADTEGFDFADYGVDGVASPVKENVGIVIRAKEDPVEPVKPTTSAPTPTDSFGQIAEVVTPSNSFVVVKTVKPAEVKVEAPKVKEPGEVSRLETTTHEAKIEMAEVKPQELVATKNGNGVVIENKSDVDFLDSLPTKSKEDGMRVASRTKNGITIMKIKE